MYHERIEYPSLVKEEGYREGLREPGRRIRCQRQSLRKTCLKVMRAEGVRRDAVVSVSALDENEISELNRRYLSRMGPTDVLAFPLGEESVDGYLLGDVLICPATCNGQERGIRVEKGRELDFVAAHGVLHLLAMKTTTRIRPTSWRED